MKTVTQLLDSFVALFKSCLLSESVRFIHGGKGSVSENPVRKPLVACTVGKVYTEGFGNVNNSRVQLDFSVYIPHTRGERELSVLCDKLYSCISGSESQMNVESVTLGKAEYVNEFYALCRTLSVVVGTETPKSEEETPAVTAPKTQVSIDGKEPVNVSDVQVFCEHSAYVVREYLADEGYALRNHLKKYTVKITAPADALVFIDCKRFSLLITQGEKKISFSDCRLKSISGDISKKQVYTVECEDKE